MKRLMEFCLRRSWVSLRLPMVWSGRAVSPGAARRPAKKQRRETVQLHVQSLEPKLALAASVATKITVQPGDTGTDGLAVARSISRSNGSFIRNLATQAVASTAITPPNTVRVLVDATKPGVAFVRGPSAGTYTAGSTLSFTVRFTEPVFATAADRKQLILPIVIGGTTRDASWTGEGSGTKSLTFTTVIRPGDSAPAGLQIVGPIGLSDGASLRDRAGNDVDPAVVAQFPTVNVNGVGPSPRVVEQLKAQGIVADPDFAVRIIPRGNQDAVSQPVPGSAQTIPVAMLQSSYETLFGDLDAKLGVTLSTQQNVDKINYIKGQAATGYFDLLAKPIQNNPVGVTAVAFQPISYLTTVELPTKQQSFQVSGGLIMPQGIDKTKLRGVVVYFHGTTFNKSAVPSNYSTEAQLCAELFASQGYVVVAPDYIGQGVDWKNVHPYVLYPQVSAKTAVDMLTAVKPLIASQYQLTDDDPALKLFSVGYSEGGAYSLWLNSFISATPAVLDPFYRLTHSVGLEGAYNTSNVIKNFLFSNVGTGQNNPYNIQSQAVTNLVKPLLTADAMLSFATYDMKKVYRAAFSSNYLYLNASPPISQSLCNVSGKHNSVPKAFAQQNVDCALPLFFSALNKVANRASYLSPILVDPTTILGKADLAERLTTSTKNNTQSLMSNYLISTLKGRMLLDRALAAADVNLTPCASGGVSIISLAQDSIVTPNNFDVLLKSYPDKIANAIKLNQDNFMVLSLANKLVPDIDWPLWVPVDHMQGPTYEFIYALNIFNSYADKP